MVRKSCAYNCVFLSSMGFEIRRNKNYIELLPSFNFIWEYATQPTNTIELMKRESKSVKKRKKSSEKRRKQ